MPDPGAASASGHKRKLRILVAKPGLDGHDRGAKVVARALADAGYEVIYTGLHQTAEDDRRRGGAGVGGRRGALDHLGGAHDACSRRCSRRCARGASARSSIFGGGIVPARTSRRQELGVAEMFKPGASTPRDRRLDRDASCGRARRARAHEGAPAASLRAAWRLSLPLGAWRARARGRRQRQRGPPPRPRSSASRSPAGAPCVKHGLRRQPLLREGPRRSRSTSRGRSSSSRRRRGRRAGHQGEAGRWRGEVPPVLRACLQASASSGRSRASMRGHRSCVPFAFEGQMSAVRQSRSPTCPTGAGRDAARGRKSGSRWRAAARSRPPSR